MPTQVPLVLALAIAIFSTLGFGQPPADAYQFSTASNLGNTDSLLNITKAGLGNICLNTYVQDPSQELVSCCGRIVTPGDAYSLSTKNDLIGFLPFGFPASVTIKLVASTPVGGSCNLLSSPPTVDTLASGLQASLSSPPGSPGVPFQQGQLNAADLTMLTSLCQFIVANGSGFGICRTSPKGTPATNIYLSGLLAPNGSYLSPVEVTLVATDPNGASDIASTVYSVDAGPDVNYLGPFTVTGNGPHTIQFRTSDREGNVEPLQVRTLNIRQDGLPSAGVLFQQGPKLVGADAVEPAQQGQSVALSADGNTALVGGGWDNNSTGAAWVYIRNGGVWTQQGPKLAGTGAVGPSPDQGSSVALSADGNTALVGGVSDNNFTGAVWVFTRSGGVWTQQGPKLVGTGAVGSSQQGLSVALAADGNTALVGGNGDNSITGAAWVFTRSDGVWTQQGPKLVGAGVVGRAEQGRTVALSADGNTALIGGDGDDGGVGAVWVFTRSGGVWTQQGPKLIGTGANHASQGWSVALSADGNTAAEIGPGFVWVFVRSGGAWTQQEGPYGVGGGGIQAVALSANGNTVVVGAYGDNNYIGALWVLNRRGGVWTQQGPKLVGAGAVGGASQGFAIALSADGSTVIEGGLGDNGRAGAVWVFATPPRDAFQVRYASNLNIGDSVVNLTNSGVVSGFDPDGRICVNVYTFDPAEEMVSCCACLVTPNGLNSLSVRNDLLSNPLTPGVPTSLVIKLLASTPISGICNAAAPTTVNLVGGMGAWGTTLHALPTVPVTYGSTVTPFSAVELSASELTKLTTFCGFIQANGSGFGICKSCQKGALGAAQK